MEGNLNIEIKASDMNTNVRSFVNKLNNNEYDVTYFAMETGLLRIFIKWNDQPIHGSPFKSRVVNPAKVHLLGINNHHHSIDSSLQNLYTSVKLNEQKTLVFDTHEAGPGCLNVRILSDKYETIPFKKIVHNNLQKIYFSTFCDGEFRLNFDWSSYPIAMSTIVAQTEAYAIAKKVKIIFLGVIEVKNQMMLGINHITEVKTTYFSFRYQILTCQKRKMPCFHRILRVA